MYAQPHRHDVFPDHLERVKYTIEMGARAVRNMLDGEDSDIMVADLSCGDAAIAKGIAARFDPGRVKLFLGDFAPGYPNTGTVEETLPNIPIVDLFVSCETLEHVDDPLGMLSAIYRRTHTLLLTTPVDNWNDDNPEHIWAWSKSDVDELLATAGFIAYRYEELNMTPQGFPYKWGMWLAS